MFEIKYFVIATCLWAVAVTGSEVSEDAVGTQEKTGKVIPLFNVVRFLNDVCSGTNTRNGTCFTSQECSEKGGTSAGSCAEGFGVCCTFVLKCGGTSSANNTYLVQTSTTEMVDKSCVYSVCPTASTVCRIRYDFTTLTLTGPAATPGVATGSATPMAPMIPSIGNCVTSGVSFMGQTSSPTICGTNTGEHIIVDSDGSHCQMVNFFNDGSSAANSNSWDIWVTQYQCGEMDVTRAGPRGCLQYFTGATNIVKSFAFRSNAATTGTGSTVGNEQHLNNQDYTVCVRREFGKKQICWMMLGGTTNAITDQGNYGLSIASAAIADAVVGTSCSQDYITIPGASNVIPATLATAVLDRFCGRVFATANAETTVVSVCSVVTPFTLGVHFDGNELTPGAQTDMAQMSELSVFPTGNIGFALVYQQT